MEDLLIQAADNLGFLLICMGIIGILALVARLTERKLTSLHQPGSARRITIVAICGSLAAVLHILDFPLLFLAPEFYKLDFSELPVMLCGFYLGPSAAVTCEAVKILLKLLLKGTSTAFVGDFANFVVGCSFVLPAAILYHLKKTRTGAVWALAAGTIVLTIFGSLFNAVYLLPKFAQMYFGKDLNVIISLGSAVNPAVSDLPTFLFLCVVPLNLIKGISVSVLTVLLYKRVARPLFGHN